MNMTSTIVEIHGRLFPRFESPSEPPQPYETSCSIQTCGTAGEIAPIDWEYETITPEQAQRDVPGQARECWKRWWESPAGERERQYRRKRKIERQRCIAASKREQKEKLRERKRGWAQDAMRCDLPNPFPEAFPS